MLALVAADESLLVCRHSAVRTTPGPLLHDDSHAWPTARTTRAEAHRATQLVITTAAIGCSSTCQVKSSKRLDVLPARASSAMCNCNQTVVQAACTFLVAAPSSDDRHGRDCTGRDNEPSSFLVWATSSLTPLCCGQRQGPNCSEAPEPLAKWGHKKNTKKMSQKEFLRQPTVQTKEPTETHWSAYYTFGTHTRSS